MPPVVQDPAPSRPKLSSTRASSTSRIPPPRPLRTDILRKTSTEPAKSPAQITRSTSSPTKSTRSPSFARPRSSTVKRSNSSTVSDNIARPTSIVEARNDGPKEQSPRVPDDRPTNSPAFNMLLSQHKTLKGACNELKATLVSTLAENEELSIRTEELAEIHTSAEIGSNDEMEELRRRMAKMEEENERLQRELADTKMELMDAKHLGDFRLQSTTRARQTSRELKQSLKMERERSDSLASSIGQIEESYCDNNMPNGQTNSPSPLSNKVQVHRGGNKPDGQTGSPSPLRKKVPVYSGENAPDGQTSMSPVSKKIQIYRDTNQPAEHKQGAAEQLSQLVEELTVEAPNTGRTQITNDEARHQVEIAEYKRKVSALQDLVAKSRAEAVDLREEHKFWANELEHNGKALDTENRLWMELARSISNYLAHESTIISNDWLKYAGALATALDLQQPALEDQASVLNNLPARKQFIRDLNVRLGLSARTQRTLVSFAEIGLRSRHGFLERQYLDADEEVLALKDAAGTTAMALIDAHLYRQPNPSVPAARDDAVYEDLYGFTPQFIGKMKGCKELLEMANMRADLMRTIGRDKYEKCSFEGFFRMARKKVLNKRIKDAKHLKKVMESEEIKACLQNMEHERVALTKAFVQGENVEDDVIKD